MKLTFLLISFLLSPSRSLNRRLYGVNYSLRIGPDWTTGAERCKSVEQVRSELQTLKKEVTDNVRVYSMTDCDTGRIMLEQTKEVSMNLWLGIWVGPSGSVFPEERQRLLELLETHDFSHVIGMHVSSEAIFRGDIDTDAAIRLRDTIREDIAPANLGGRNIPITVSDIIESNMDSQDLLTVDPMVVTFNQFPFWDQSTDINDAAKYMSDRIRVIEDRSEGRQIILTETGWADAGSNDGSNAANAPSMAKFLRDFVCLAEERDWKYFWFTSFDSSWRRVNEGKPNDVEGHFGKWYSRMFDDTKGSHKKLGLFNEDGTLKSHIESLTIDCEEPAVDLEPEFLEESTSDGSRAVSFSVHAVVALLTFFSLAST